MNVQRPGSTASYCSVGAGRPTQISSSCYGPPTKLKVMAGGHCRPWSPSQGGPFDPSGGGGGQHHHDERCQAEAPGRQGRLAPQGSLLKCFSPVQSLSLISCSHDCLILLSVAIRGQPSGPAGRPITVTVVRVPLKPKAGLARPWPGRASPTDRWTPSRASATGRPTEKQPPPHRGPTPESSGPLAHARTRQPC